MQTNPPDPESVAAPFDTCECGDFRHQHQGGTGRCNLGSLCRPARCLQFRLYETETTYAAKNPKHYAMIAALQWKEANNG